MPVFDLLTGVSVRVATRPPSQLLGINGRDDGQVVSSFSSLAHKDIKFDRQPWLSHLALESTHFHF